MTLSRFVLKQFRRVAIGIVIGSVAAAITHLIIRDSVFMPTIRFKWQSLNLAHAFDGFGAYTPELYAALVGISALIAIPGGLYLWRFLRAWWAGITSVTTLVSLGLTAAVLLCGVQESRIGTAFADIHQIVAIEAARALNIVFIAAQKLSRTSAAQQILEGAMTRATDDTFAKRLLEYTQDRDRNKILTDFSNVDTDKLKRAFIDRMLRRYGATADVDQVDITKGDWWAFRIWAENSSRDGAIEQEFWRRFIGTNRKRLAQTINFIYPGGSIWQEDPRPIVDKFFPTSEIGQLLNTLPADQLEEIEAKGIERFERLLQGKYPRGPDEL